jgi:glycosyltransferase involved in cell wall biosynthesis
MHVPKGFSFLGSNSLLSLFFKVYAHILLPCRISKRNSSTILVREFLTLPLLLVSPFLYRRRNKIWFLCQHNIAFAAKNVNHRISLRILSRLGFRFIVYDNSALWTIIDKNPNQYFIKSIPLPVQSFISKEDIKLHPHKSLRIGLVGNFRPEQSPLWAVETILHEIQEGKQLFGYSMLIGSPNPFFLSKFSNVVTLVNTSSYKNYISALRSCDILVLAYDEGYYSYRTSGILAEAVGCGCAIVAPDLPALRNQVHTPASIGATYTSKKELIAAVLAAANLIKNEDFTMARNMHLQYRGKDGIRTALKKLLNDAT